MQTETAIIEKLNSSIIMAKYDYLQHKELFLGKDAETQKFVLTETAHSFFSQLNGLLWDRMILSISKLTDPYISAHNKSLSIAYLVHVSAENKMKCASEEKLLFDKLVEIVTPIRKYRSKNVAHKDLSSAFYSKLSVQIKTIEESFSLIERMMNIYHLERSNVQWGFDLSGWKDAGSLVYFLKQGLIYEWMKRTRKDWRQDALEEHQWESTLPKSVSETKID